MRKIVITGGTGRFGSILKQKKNNNKLIFPNKKTLNIENFKNIKKYLSKTKPDILIHWIDGELKAVGGHLGHILIYLFQSDPQQPVYVKSGWHL